MNDAQRKFREDRWRRRDPASGRERRKVLDMNDASRGEDSIGGGGGERERRGRRVGKEIQEGCWGGERQRRRYSSRHHRNKDDLWGVGGVFCEGLKGARERVKDSQHF